MILLILSFLGAAVYANFCQALNAELLSHWKSRRGSYKSHFENADLMKNVALACGKEAILNFREYHVTYRI